MITEIIHNWYATSENGEEYTRVIVGKTYPENGELLSISEHSALGEGDKWYYDLEFSSGKIIRVFNPNTVTRSN